MKIRIVQKDINNLAYRPFLDAAERESVDLVCLGELGLSGCLYQPQPVTPFQDVLDSLSVYRTAILTGLPYQDGSGLHNTCLYYYRGNHQLYHKVNLFPLMNEPSVFQAGKTPGLFETIHGRIGVAICYDIRFPELFDQLKKGKPNIIFVPAAFPLVRIEDWRRLLIERAIQTGTTTVGINAVGDDGTNLFGGNSMAVAPDGRVLAETDRSSECVLDVII